MSIIQLYLGAWLLQIVSTIFPMLLFQSFFRKKYGNVKTQRTLFTILCGVSIIICMTFPVSINQGYILDFRFIPLLMGFLYAGYNAGIILSLIVIIYRYFIAGIGFYLGGLTLTLIYVFIFTVVRKQLPYWDEKKHRIFSYSMLTLSLIIFATGTQFLGDFYFSTSEIVLLLLFCLLNYMTFWSVRYIQTSLKEVEQLTEKIITFEKQHTLNHLYSYLSQEMLPSIEKIKKTIDKMKKESHLDNQNYHLNDLTLQLENLEVSQKYYLSFFEQSPLDSEKINLNEEITDITKIILPFSQHYQVELAVVSTLNEKTIVKGNPSMIRLALLTVIKNAIESSEPNEKVDIALHELVEKVYIVIENYGKRIDSSLENPSKISGAEFGLSTVKKIVENLGGNMEMKGISNNGTIISLYLPKA